MAADGFRKKVGVYVNISICADDRKYPTAKRAQCIVRMPMRTKVYKSCMGILAPMCSHFPLAAMVLP